MGGNGLFQQLLRRLAGLRVEQPGADHKYCKAEHCSSRDYTAREKHAIPTRAFLPKRTRGGAAPNGVNYASPAQSRLEVKLESQLDDAIAKLDRGISECSVGIHRAVPFGPGAKSRYVLFEPGPDPGETPDRVIQEIVSRKPELQFLRLADLEVLKHRKVAVEEPRSEILGQNDGPVHAGSRRNRETVAVDILVRSRDSLWDCT